MRKINKTICWLLHLQIFCSPFFAGAGLVMFFRASRSVLWKTSFSNDFEEMGENSGAKVMYITISTKTD